MYTVTLPEKPLSLAERRKIYRRYTDTTIVKVATKYVGDRKEWGAKCLRYAAGRGDPGAAVMGVAAAPTLLAGCCVSCAYAPTFGSAWSCGSCCCHLWTGVGGGIGGGILGGAFGWLLYKFGLAVCARKSGMRIVRRSRGFQPVLKDQRLLAVVEIAKREFPSFSDRFKGVGEFSLNPMTGKQKQYGLGMVMHTYVRYIACREMTERAYSPDLRHKIVEALPLIERRLQTYYNEAMSGIAQRSDWELVSDLAERTYLTQVMPPFGAMKHRWLHGCFASQLWARVRFGGSKKELSQKTSLLKNSEQSLTLPVRRYSPPPEKKEISSSVSLVEVD